MKPIVMPGSGKGFSLLELLVVVCIVGVLASVLFKRVLYYQEMAEKAVMQQVVGALQSALIIQYGHRLTLGKSEEVNKLRDENPLDWLSLKPSNYAGEIASVNNSTVEPGNWVFDLQTRELIYVPEHVEFFIPKNNSHKWIRFRTRFEFAPLSGQSGRVGKQVAAVTFSPVVPYQWVILAN